MSLAILFLAAGTVLVAVGSPLAGRAAGTLAGARGAPTGPVVATVVGD